MFCVERLLINFPGQKDETIVNQHFSVVFPLLGYYVRYRKIMY